MGAWRALSELGASFSAADVLVLCYHSIRSRERFAAQMTVLAERGYPVLSMGQFTEWLNGRKPIRTPAVLLTFDGGYLDQLEKSDSSAFERSAIPEEITSIVSLAFGRSMVTRLSL